MANTIQSDLQQLSQPSPWVSLYSLDLTVLGGSIFYFTPNIYPNGSFVVFNGITYTPLPIAMSGWEIVSTSSGGQATQPRPTLTVSNANKTLLITVISLGDLVGGTFTRIRTYQKYLDGQPNADPTQIIGPDVYKINQKTSHKKDQISFQLVTALDIPNAQIPARQILKDPSLLDPEGFPGVQTY